ncbi:MAG: response regulator [Gemmatimonadota bacterium]
MSHAFQILMVESGYIVAEASSGGEALERARETPPDLILLDLGLPDANGLEIVRRIKGDPLTRDSVVVAVTGRALETDRDACLEAGCAAYLPKPIDTARLLGTIEEMLG